MIVNARQPIVMVTHITNAHPPIKTCKHYPYGPADKCPWCENEILKKKISAYEEAIRKMDKAFDLPDYEYDFEVDEDDD